LGYVRPDWLQNGDKKWSEDMQKVCMHPFEEIEVVQRRPSQDEKCINIDDPIIAFTNRLFKKKINLNVNESDSSHYGTAMNSLKDGQGLNISFHRTIRMPDDDKLHQLPGSLGTFPIYNVNAYADRLPDNIVQQGGVFLPMWQREALWINFDTPYRQKYALRIFVGRINAVSGLSMDEKVDEPQGAEMLQDYVVVPGQRWLDGICVAPGIVRQFVAMPCMLQETQYIVLTEPLRLTKLSLIKWVQDTPLKAKRPEKRNLGVFRSRSFPHTRHV
jgi:hypothetical protein